MSSTLPKPSSLSPGEISRIDNEASKWQDNPKNQQRWRFLASAIPALDYVLKKMVDADTENPLAEIFYESLMICRETLNCWSNRALHDVALESFTQRCAKLSHAAATMREKHPEKTKGVLLVAKKPGGSFKEKKLKVKLEALSDVVSGKVLMDMNTICGVQEVRGGLTSDFNVMFKKPDPSGALVEHILYFRAKNDSERQAWLNVFSLYQQRNRANKALEMTSIKQRLHLYTHVVFSPVPEFSKDKPIYAQTSLDKEKDFLFATTTCEDSSRLVLFRGKEITSDGDRDRSSSLSEKRSKVAIIERFPVKWVQKIGRDKPRQLEIDLNNSPRIICYKPDEENKVGQEFLRHHLIDYKIESKNELMITFFREEKLQSRKYVFSSELQLRRFSELLLMFQAVPDRHRLVYMHDDVLHFLAHITTESQRDKDQHAFKLAQTGFEENEVVDIFRSQFHSLLTATHNSCPENQHSWELVQKSNELSFDVDGDLKRVQALAKKLYAVEEKVASVKDLKCDCTIKHGLNLTKNKILPPTITNYCYLRFYKSFIKNRGIEALKRFLDASQQDLQVWAIKALFQLFVVQPLTDKCQGIVEITDYDWTPTSFPLPWYLNHMSVNRPLPVGIIDVLFELLLGLPPVLDRSDEKPSPSSSSPTTASPSFSSSPHSSGGSPSFFPHPPPSLPPPLTKSSSSSALLTPLPKSSSYSVHTLPHPPPHPPPIPPSLATSSASTSPSSFPASPPSKNEINVLNKVIVEKNFIPSLLACLKRAEPLGTERGLANILVLLKRPENAMAFLDCTGWQKWIFPLLFEKGIVIVTESMSYKYIISIFTVLHFTWLTDPEDNFADSAIEVKERGLSLASGLGSSTHGGGDDVIEKRQLLTQNPVFRSLLILRKLHKVFDKQSISVGRQLLLSLYSTVTARVREVARNFDYQSPTWPRILSLLSVTEEFIFYTRAAGKGGLATTGVTPTTASTTTSPLQLWMDDDDVSCSDFPLLEKVVESLKSLAFHQPALSSASATEKRFKKAAQEEFEFWSQCHICLKGLCKTTNVDARAMILRQLVTVLSERNVKHKYRVYDYRKGKTVAEISDKLLLTRATTPALSSPPPSPLLDKYAM